MNLLKTTTLFAVVLLAVAGQASAVMLGPSYRGDENSVHAIFDWVGDQPAGATALFVPGRWRQ